jgi:hypothetical protein
VHDEIIFSVPAVDVSWCGVNFRAIEQRLPLFPVLPRMSVCEPLLDWKPIKPKPKDQTVETKHKIEIELTEGDLHDIAYLQAPPCESAQRAAKAKLKELRREREETARKAAAAEQRAKDLERIVSRRVDRTELLSGTFRHCARPSDKHNSAALFTTAVEANMFVNMGEMFRLLRYYVNADVIHSVTTDKARALVRKIETGE